MTISGDPAGEISVTAPAKINLSLNVTGRRADGYHLLDSLVVFAEVHDVIRASLANDLTLAIDGPFAHGLERDEGNLVLKAARRLIEKTGTENGAALRLTKNLPVASGIGGGSADAAATLLALDRLWELNMSPAELAETGLSLGADVPVCLFGKPARMRGIGEIIEPLPDMPSAHLLLVNPGVSVSTPAVFQGLKILSDSGEKLADIPPVPDLTALISVLKKRTNDLAALAISLAPVIGEVLKTISGQDGCLLARMSGSGATCFGLFEDARSAEQAAREISDQNESWWVCPTRIRSANR